MTTQTEFFEKNDPKQPGYVSDCCRFVDDAEQRMILIFDRPVYIYDLRDKLAMRQIWVHVYENGYATYQQIANAVGIGVRTIKFWVKRFRKEGAKGLIDRARSGCPRKVTKALRKRIYRLRDAGATYYEIARKCQISVSSVQKVLHERKREAERQQTSMDLGDVGKCDAHNQVDEEFAVTQEATANKRVNTTHVVEKDTSAELSTDKDSADVCGCAKIGNNEIHSSKDELENEQALDRWFDRELAHQGLLQDAKPLFAQGDKVEWAGVFIAVVMLSTDSFLDVAHHVYGQFKAAFYGVRTVMMTLMLMAMLRIKRVEHLRQNDPVKLGRVLGLDRAPEVKTLRRKLGYLASGDKAAQFMDQVAKARLQEYKGDVKTVLVDGHVQAYSGQVQIGKVYSNRQRRVVKGRTEHWVNLHGMCPLFSVISPFNEGLVQALPKVLEKTKEVIGEDSLTCIFDRGGYSASLFESLINDGYHIITYRKGNYEPVSLGKFTKKTTLINGKEYDYDYEPYEQKIHLPVYEEVGIGKRNKKKLKKTNRNIELREIRIQRSDGGQTSILTDRDDLTATEVAGSLFDRWASQENIFKYLLHEYDLDCLWNYGDEAIEETLYHPNPKYTKLEKQLDTLCTKRKTILAKYSKITKEENEETMIKTLRKLRKSKAANALEELSKQIAAAKQRMETMDAREEVSKSGYRQLKSQMKMLANTIKMHAYTIETKLYNMLELKYTNKKKEGRRLIAAALQTSGRLRLEPNKLVIQLEPQSSPNRTQAINQLCEQLNELKAIYPGSDRIIEFEPTPIEP